MTHTMRSILMMRSHPVIGPVLRQLDAWPHWPLARQALEDLPAHQLFDSATHGAGHTERVILLGAVCAMDQGFDARDTWYTAQACTYHDVGRRDDWEDSGHSRRSARLLPSLADVRGDDLALLQAAIHAHSGPDDEAACLRVYAPQDEARCRRVMRALQDADRLDRVRLGDLNPSYLNARSSIRRIPLARALFRAYLGSV
ncbi:MAG: HD domain-containing protein [Clostridiales bacterium]|nr:HD domain-containing protein [Clostridiales bacterium]